MMGPIRQWLLSMVAAMCLWAGPSHAMWVQWTDPVGDGSAVGDVVSIRLDFDATGAWTARWRADAAHPFTGKARFNLNLFDAALGNPATATTSQANLDADHDFGSASVTDFGYSGVSAALTPWSVGDVIVTGNNSTFLSGIVDLGMSQTRDNVVASARVQADVAEPGTLALWLTAFLVLPMTRGGRWARTGGSSAAAGRLASPARLCHSL